MNDLYASDQVKDRIVDMIKKSRVRMKPRWYFVSIAGLFAVAILSLFFILLYAASLSVFLLRESGVWFAPSFGARGWFALMRSIPVSHIVFIILCIILLEILIRRYAFVYRHSVAGSLFTIVVLIAAGDIIIVHTPFHRSMAFYMRGHQLPPPLTMPYGSSFRVTRPSDLYEGTIVSMGKDGFVISYKNDGDGDRDDGRGAATSTVLITLNTRLPYGADFNVGTTVVVVGDSVATNTIQAFGVRSID